MYDSFSETGDVLLKLLIATILGGIIGLEREVHDRPAGLRTHTLVCLGSAVYMMLSVSFAVTGRADPGRIAAQVATGIGFLGAGTIIRHGDSVKGLTTAASIWAVAAIGLCVGRGGTGYIIATAATLFAFGILRGLSVIEHRIAIRRRIRHLVVQYRNGNETLNEIQAMLAHCNVEITTHEIVGEIDDIATSRLTVIIPPGALIKDINIRLISLGEVQSVAWD